MFKVPEKYRVKAGPLGSDERYGNNGLFMFPNGLGAVASDGGGWEHVSVSPNEARTPTWEEMTWAAEQFWSPDAVLYQFRPAAKDYVNHHPYCLHWWRPIGKKILLPPSWMVGPLRND